MKSTIPDGRRPVCRPVLFGTKTNSAQAEAGARAELGKNDKICILLDRSCNFCQVSYMWQCGRCLLVDLKDLFQVSRKA